jgi:8-amino-7-oxononanoate synthase
MSLNSPWNTYIQQKLTKAHTENRYRCLRDYDSFQPSYLIKNNRHYLNLCSNDYLGLASDIESQEEAKILAGILPSGSGASRLVTGNLVIHSELEKMLANWKGTESALVFPSGFQTNLGLISALANKGDALFSDKLNHASIIDGCSLSGAAFHRYRHKDPGDLESLLKTKRPKKRIIITDGVFSMDGDIAPLPDLNKIAKRYGALLIVDEAHATGVLGANGAGSWSHYGLPVEDHVILMGTMSKALGVQGGYICASRAIIDYLINYCRAFIYSTGLSPLLAGVIHYNIARVQSSPHLIESLHKATGSFQNSLKEHGVDFTPSQTPIIPVIIGESAKAVACAEKLYAQGIVASAIRPPTVPDGTARLRLSISAAHTLDDLHRAAAEIAKILLSKNEVVQDHKTCPAR